MKRRKQTWLISGCALAAVVSTACGRRVETAAREARAGRDLPGVVRGENELDAPSVRERGDGWLELKIRAKLVLESAVNLRGTRVSVSDGIVTLAGITETDTQRSLIEVIARNVEGVKDVRNELRVRPVQAIAEGGGRR